MPVGNQCDGTGVEACPTCCPRGMQNLFEEAGGMVDANDHIDDWQLGFRSSSPHRYQQPRLVACNTCNGTRTIETCPKCRGFGIV